MPRMLHMKWTCCSLCPGQDFSLNSVAPGSRHIHHQSALTQLVFAMHALIGNICGFIHHSLAHLTCQNSARWACASLICNGFCAHPWASHLYTRRWTDQAFTMLEGVSHMGIKVDQEPHSQSTSAVSGFTPICWQALSFPLWGMVD
jgi:hypothetical protein